MDNMATVGFEKAIIGILDNTGKATEVFEVNAAEGGAINAKVSGLGATNNITYASNVPFHVAAQGVSSPKVELEIADLTAEILEAISGATTDPTTGIMKIGSKTRPPYIALILKSSDKDGNDLYFGFMKGKFTRDGFELKTQEDKGVELATDSISADFIARSSDEWVYAQGSTASTGFTPEAFKSFVMPGISAGA